MKNKEENQNDSKKGKRNNNKRKFIEEGNEFEEDKENDESIINIYSKIT